MAFCPLFPEKSSHHPSSGQGSPTAAPVWFAWLWPCQCCPGLSHLSPAPGVLNSSWPHRKTPDRIFYKTIKIYQDPKDAKDMRIFGAQRCQSQTVFQGYTRHSGWWIILWKTCSHRLGQVKIVVFLFFFIILVIITFIIFLSFILSSSFFYHFRYHFFITFLIIFLSCFSFFHFLYHFF